MGPKKRGGRAPPATEALAPGPPETLPANPTPNAGVTQGLDRGQRGRGSGSPASAGGSARGVSRQGPSVQGSVVGVAPASTGEVPSARAISAALIGPVAEAERALGGLALSPAGVRKMETLEVPESVKGVSLCKRPNFGTMGEKYAVKTNYYQAECSLDFIYQHDVVVKQTPSRGEGEVSTKGIRRAVMRQVVKVREAGGLKNCLPAFDGNKILFTAQPLRQERIQFEIVLPEEAGQTGRERKFNVEIKPAVGGHIDMSRLHQQASQQYEIPQDAINALDTILRETPTYRDTPVGRSFFVAPNPKLLREAALGAGLEAWRGYYQSVRPTGSGLVLNLDFSTTAFYQPVEVLRYLYDVMGHSLDMTQPVSDADRLKIRRLLKGVKVEATHNPKCRRKYRVHDISKTSAAETMFDLEEAGQVRRVSVATYFDQYYGYRLKHPHLPCIIVVSNKAHIPLEACCIQGGQRFPRKLTNEQIGRMLRITQKGPLARELATHQTFQQNKYTADKYAREFGISVSDSLMEVESRILPPPLVSYANRGITPVNGEWKPGPEALFVEGIVINSWAVLNFEAVPDFMANRLAVKLARRCNELGMHMEPRPLVSRYVLEEHTLSLGLLREYLQGLVSDVNKNAQAKGHPLQLVVCIFGQTSPELYGFLKRLSVTELGFVTQGCLAKHLERPGPAYLGNLALKINVKVASDQVAYQVASDRVALKRIGCNFTLDPALTNPDLTSSLFPPGGATIVFGADVSHPAPGNDALSIAAVVASQDWPYQGRYRAMVSTQEKHQEMIQSFNETVRSMLLSFYQATTMQPQHIIVYRDGVSEGQFMQVLLLELDAIQKACGSLAVDYRPQITFVVVQKRHHTRFFPTQQGPKDRSGNVPAGTVVDTGITHPTQFDFFLNSHAGLLGTSRPTRYIVLYDENGFSADGMQTLSNALCYTYARCTRSVSIVPPVYYAHLAAAQARHFADPVGSDGGSASGSTSSAASRHVGPPAVRPLPLICIEVTNTMFFC